MNRESDKELQKRLIDEHFSKYESEIIPFKYLWKLDDKLWVQERVELWNQIIEYKKQKEGKRFVKSYWDRHGRFFLKATPRKSDEHIYSYERYTYTPFTTIEQIKSVYESTKENSRANLHKNWLFSADRFYKTVPREFYRVKLIADAIYNAEYVAKCSPGANYFHALQVVEPIDFIYRYARGVSEYIKLSSEKYLARQRKRDITMLTGKERSFVEVTMEYFIENLNFSIDSEHSARIDKEVIRKMCDSLISYNPDVENTSKDEFVKTAQSRLVQHSFIRDL